MNEKERGHREDKKSWRRGNRTLGAPKKGASAGRLNLYTTGVLGCDGRGEKEERGDLGVTKEIKIMRKNLE